VRNSIDRYALWYVVFVTAQDRVPGNSGRKRRIPPGATCNSPVHHKQRISRKYYVLLRFVVIVIGYSIEKSYKRLYVMNDEPALCSVEEIPVLSICSYRMSHTVQ